LGPVNGLEREKADTSRPKWDIKERQASPWITKRALDVLKLQSDVVVVVVRVWGKSGG
jgi:hypothetical protein